MKIALVHDYLREYGGAERVIEVFHELWPDAPLYTSFVDFNALGDHAKKFTSWDIRTSWVQHNPFVKRFHSPMRFLAPFIWNSFDLSDYDIVISSSGWFICRGVALASKIQNPKSLHVCYIHHPPRNLYGYDTGSLVQKYWPVKIYAQLINFFLRHYDFETAQKVDYFVANSKETARRVEKFYRRESTVIYPPVAVEHPISNIQSPKSYYLLVGRLTYSKRIDILIAACNKLSLPLKIVGTGTEESYLQSIAGPTIQFLGPQTDEQISTLYLQAKALLFCARNEDFGMVPVEAMAHGVPVIALAEGGVKETVIDKKTGILFNEPTIDSVIHAIKEFERMPNDWDTPCKKQAQKFSTDIFKKSIQEFIKNHRS